MNITIQNIINGNIRVTGSINGRTVTYKEGFSSDAKTLLAEVMAVTCIGHRIGNLYDMTYITLNLAAKAAMA